MTGAFSPDEAVAGVVAEWLSYDDADADAYAIVEGVELGVVELSPTDAASLPAGAAESGALFKAVAEAVDCLNRHRAFFEWAVADLIEGETIPNGMAAERFKAHEAELAKG